MRPDLAEVIRLANARGCTDGEIARVLGYSKPYIGVIRRAHRIPSILGPGMQPIVPKERLQEICDRLRNGETLQQIGDSFGVTRERIRQLASKNGLTGQIGIAKRREIAKSVAKDRAAKRREERDGRYQKTYGCSFAEVMALNEGLPFSNQKSKAYNYRSWLRNVVNTIKADASLTFPQWCEIWKEKWDERGRGFGYHLSRLDREKGFVPENVVVERGDVAMKRHRKLRPWNTSFKNPALSV